VRRLLSRITGPNAFRPLLLLAVAAVYLNIVSGALVRVTGSGLGCPDWPLCNGKATPPFHFHGLIEFSNRVLALAVIVIAILLAVSAWRAGMRRTHRWRFRASVAIGVGTFLQGPLGGVTVLVDLHPLSVMSHFVLALVVLVIAIALALDEFEVAADWPALPPRWVPIGGVVVAAWAWLVILSGAVVTMSGTHPGSEGVPRLWNLLDAAYLHVRVAASFTIVIAVFLLLLAFAVRTPRAVQRLAWLLVIVVGLQIVVGELQWRSQLPWWMVLIHVAFGALALGAAAAFGWTLAVSRRPARRLR
jgi:cytochrome c oxidase assembly protein subunit 15